MDEYIDRVMAVLVAVLMTGVTILVAIIFVATLWAGYREVFPAKPTPTCPCQAEKS